MPTHVADLEMTAPLTDIPLRPGVTGLLALVRRHGRAVGIVRLRTTGHVSAAQLQAAIAAQVPLSAAELEPRSLAAPVTIIVCTRDRTELLRSCLEGLRAQAAAGHEVVIVDNAPSDDRTARLVAGYPYRYEREPQPGLDRARNRGFAAARHEIVAFTDDDCVPDASWIDALVRGYSDPEIAAVTGQVVPLELETEGQERFERFETWAANRRRFEPKVYRRATTPPATGGVVGLGANMSFRRAALEALGGFDARFDCGMPTLSSGDTEMFARVLAADSAIAYRPDAVVWHRHRRELAAVRRVVFGYGVGLHAFFMKRLLEDGDAGVLGTAPRWLLGPALKAIWGALLRRPTAPADLLLMQLWGALHGPLRYHAVRRAVVR